MALSLRHTTKLVRCIEHAGRTGCAAQPRALTTLAPHEKASHPHHGDVTSGRGKTEYTHGGEYIALWPWPEDSAPRAFDHEAAVVGQNRKLDGAETEGNTTGNHPVSAPSNNVPRANGEPLKPRPYQ